MKKLKWQSLASKALAGVAAVSMAASAMPAVPVAAADSSDEIKIECESGEMTGISKAGVDKTASGGKYADLLDNADSITMNVKVPKDGLYDIIVCYKAAYGNKINYMYVNGTLMGDISSSVTEWTETNLGAGRMKKGTNELKIQGSWGWCQFDYIRLVPASLPKIHATQVTPCDPKATKETKALMKYFSKIYGKHILSGQQEIYNGGHTNNDFDTEFKYLEKTTGKLPAIRGFDFLNTNPLYGYPDHSTDDGTVDRMIDWARNGGICTASWHITVPSSFASYNLGDSMQWSQATYSEKTDFDASKIMTKGTKENKYWDLCLKGLVPQLKKLQDAKVPLIFRPFHEAEGSGGEKGSWFWWGAKGSKVYKDLWQYTYKILTEDYGIHNLIWEFNSYNYETSTNWYPGDDYVDLIGLDKYSCTDWSTGSARYYHNDTSMSSAFYGLMKKYDFHKMITMPENDCFSTVDNLKGEKAGWLYFCTWYDTHPGNDSNPDFLSDPVFNTKKDTIEMYTSNYCITRDELPAKLYGTK